MAQLVLKPVARATEEAPSLLLLQGCDELEGGESMWPSNVTVLGKAEAATLKQMSE